MSNLIVDIGNTNTKLFLFEKNNLISRHVYLNNDNGLDDETSGFLLKNSITNCIISSVRTINNNLLNILENNFNTMFFTHGMNLPVSIEYKSPETLGLDRIAAVSGASVLFPNRDCLVIDAGTAITYDILTRDKKYPGGNISPGISTRFKALHTFTGKLPLLSINKDINGLYGNTTKNAIPLGVQNGIIYEVMGTIKAFKDIYNDLLIVFTGGDSFFFEKSLKLCIFVEPNLTAIGLNKILELNV